jgi:molybdopterin-guanine dinucleotide biosynthesis protein A
VIEPGLSAFAAVVLAGGQATRLGGADKASIEINGRTLLEHALDAVIDAGEVVVVGEQVPTDRPVTFVVEEPRYGGPAAGLLTGRGMLLRWFPTIAVLAVDMPHLTSSTFRRLHEAAVGHEGAALTDADGRRQLAFVVETARLDAVSPDLEGRHGMSIRALLEPLDLVDVPAVGPEARDIDSWSDLRDARTGQSDPLAGTDATDDRE